MRKYLIVLIAVLAVSLTGCEFSVGGNLDMEEVETGISDGLEEQLDVEIESVDCPEEVKMEKGNDFECTATDSEGSSATISVVQTNDDGNLDWEITQ